MTPFTSRWSSLPILNRDVNPETDTVVEWGMVRWLEDEHGKYMAQQAIVEIRPPFPANPEDRRGYARIGMETLDRSRKEGQALLKADTAKRGKAVKSVVSRVAGLLRKRRKMSKTQPPPEREP